MGGGHQGSPPAGGRRAPAWRLQTATVIEFPTIRPTQPAFPGTARPSAVWFYGAARLIQAPPVVNALRH